MRERLRVKNSGDEAPGEVLSGIAPPVAGDAARVTGGDLQRMGSGFCGDLPSACRQPVGLLNQLGQPSCEPGRWCAVDDFVVNGDGEVEHIAGL